MQKYQQLIQEDLNVGTDEVWVTAPGGGELRATQMGIHSIALGQRAYEATWAPGAIASTANASTTVTVPDAAVAAFVLASHDKMLTNALRITAHVSAADTVEVVIHNPTSASITVASGTVRVLVFDIAAVVGPEAHFTWETFGENDNVQVVSTSTGTIDTYEWEWDTGGGFETLTGTEEHFYGAWPATVTVSLRVTGPDGTDTISAVALEIGTADTGSV